VYSVAAKPIIESVMEGFNGTVFAYGQTGSGKTFTMQGPDIEDLEHQGIVPRMVRTVFNRIDNSSENIEFTVKVSMMEIYMEKIRDLLDPSKNNMMVKVDKGKGIYVHDLTERYIGSDLDVYDIMKIGNENRKVASTSMNDQSSRSHSIFVMTIHQTNLDDQTCKTGMLYLVDLAGSEKVGKTGAKGQTLDEAKGINKSLSTLGKVINSLTDGKSTHVPYRESKLTRILSESLGGNAKTALIITCSPSVYNDLETITTLRFGTAARNIKNKPKVNKELTVAEMKKLLAKTEKIIQVRSYRITVLEKKMSEAGLVIPEDEYKDLKMDIKKLDQPIEEEKIEEEEEIEVKNEFDAQEEEEEKEAEQNEMQEKLKRLQERLNIETDKYCNLSDEYEVIQNKNQQIKEQVDKLTSVKQKMTEEIEDKDDQIETLNERLIVMEEELKSLTESHEKLSHKVQKYEDMGAMYFSDIDGDQTNKKASPTETIHKELIKITQQLKAKQRIIKKIEELPNLDDQIKKILNMQDSDSKQDNESKQDEGGNLAEEIKNALMNPSLDLAIYKDKKMSIFMNEEETTKLVKAVFNLKEQQEYEEKQKKELSAQVESLRNELVNAVEESNPNIQAITNKLAEEQVQKAEV
jgi:kinesin family member 5